MPTEDAKEAKDSLQIEATGAEGASSLIEVESVVQKEYLGTGQTLDEDEVRVLCKKNPFKYFENYLKFYKSRKRINVRQGRYSYTAICWYPLTTLDHMTPKYG